MSGRVGDDRRVPALRWIGAGALLIAVLLASNHRLVTGRSSGIWDADSQFAPYYMLVADHARALRFLLWNPWCNGGSPDGFEPQFGAFSPLTAGMGLLTGGYEFGFRVYWLFLWGLGGIGMLLLGRHLGSPPWGACAVALGFVGSGIYTGHAQATPFLYSIAFLPFLIWRLDAAVQSGQSMAAAQAGALYGLSALAGHPAFTVLSGAYAALWVVGTRRALRPVLLPAVFFAVGLVVLSPAYVGFLMEGRGFTVRTAPVPRADAVGVNAFEPGAVMTFASPYLSFLKALNRETLWPRTDLSSCSLYIGATVTVLAALAIVTSPRSRRRVWLAGLAVLYLGFAFAEPIPLRGWLYDWAPPTRFFKHAALFRVYTMFSLAVLALHAVRDLASGNDGRQWKRFFLFGTVLAGLALVAYRTVFAQAADQGDRGTLPHWHFGFVWLATLAIALSGWKGSGRLRLGLGPALLVAVAALDSVLSVELNHWTMYLPGERWREIERIQRSSLDLTPNGLARSGSVVFDGMLDNKNFCLKLPVLQSYSTLENPFHREWVGTPLLRETALGQDRVWFSHAVARAAPTAEAFAAFVQRTATLGAPPLVLHSRADLLGNTGQAATVTAATREIASLPAATRIQAELRRYDPNEMALTVSCPEEGWLWVTDRWARGWRATVNGRRAQVHGGNFIFRAVPVSRGRNDVVFTYHPFGYPWLLIVSWGTMLVVLGLTLAHPRGAAVQRE